MLVRVLSIDPEEGGLLVVQAGDQTLRTMNCLEYGTHGGVLPGSEIEVELTCLHGDEEEWEQIFTANPHMEQRLMPVVTGPIAHSDG